MLSSSEKYAILNEARILVSNVMCGPDRTPDITSVMEGMKTAYKEMVALIEEGKEEVASR